MIEVIKDPGGDSRTAKEKMTWNSLQSSTKKHIDDVGNGMQFFAEMLIKAGENHDFTKMNRFTEFFEALTSGNDVKETQWYKDHITMERHHLAAHVPDDVNLIDVFEHIVDCVMACAARTGSLDNLYDIELPPEVLKKAHENTVELLKKNINIVSDIMDIEIE